MTAKELEALLVKAEHAHANFELAMGGKRDENWARWYAEYIILEDAWSKGDQSCV